MCRMFQVILGWVVELPFLLIIVLTGAPECLFDAPPDGVLRGHA